VETVARTERKVMCLEIDNRSCAPRAYAAQSPLRWRRVSSDVVSISIWLLFSSRQLLTSLTLLCRRVIKRKARASQQALCCAAPSAQAFRQLIEFSQWSAEWRSSGQRRLVDHVLRLGGGIRRIYSASPQGLADPPRTPSAFGPESHRADTL